MPTISDFTRVKILYVDDAGVSHRISQRLAVQTAVGNTLSTVATDPPRPSRWKLRHALLRYDSGTHVFNKRVVIGQVTNGIWTGATSSVTIDGVLWQVEGRIGEKRAAA